MAKLWTNITRQHILKAIELFDQKRDNYPEPRNTFLLHNDKMYPAKHIRGLAYKVANGSEILKSEYSGGEETVNFFKKHGFNIQYKKNAPSPTITKVKNEIKKVFDENNQIYNHKIARLIVTGKQYDRDGRPNYFKIENAIEKFLSKVYKKQRFEFILTPGGFLNFEFPKSLHDVNDIVKAEKEISLFHSTAEKVILDFFKNLAGETFKKLKETSDFFTIGIDGFNPKNYLHIELVAIYDLKKGKVIQWTGKFYPTEGQKRDIIKINDLNTHFTQLNSQKILILGCHDLNVFNPRGQANANPNSWKKTIADKFKKMCSEFKPDIILQHPHTTDTPNIWNLAWRTVEKELPDVKHFASGIKYYNRYGVRGDLSKVLAKTKKGDVLDFTFD
jgi:hypothetical protein